MGKYLKDLVGISLHYKCIIKYQAKNSILIQIYDQVIGLQEDNSRETVMYSHEYPVFKCSKISKLFFTEELRLLDPWQNRVALQNILTDFINHLFQTIRMKHAYLSLYLKEENDFRIILGCICIVGY